MAGAQGGAAGCAGATSMSRSSRREVMWPAEGRSDDRPSATIVLDERRASAYREELVTIMARHVMAV